jgi:hypothetical protein
MGETLVSFTGQEQALGQGILSTEMDIKSLYLAGFEKSKPIAGQ